MSGLIGLRSEITSILNGLAQALLLELCTAAENAALLRRSRETEEQLEALLNRRCVGAVDQILAAVEQQNHQNQVLVQSEEKGAGSAEGELCADQHPPTDQHSPTDHHPPTDQRPPRDPQTFLLVYGSPAAAAAVDSKCLLMALQSPAPTDHAPTGHTPTGHAPNVTTVSSSSPPLQPDLLDHEYARSSTPPPAALGGASTVELRKRKKASAPPPVVAPPPLSCPQCGVLFPNGERLAEHQGRSHPCCSACGQTFSGVLKLREHREKQHGLLAFSCDYCPKTFNHKAHRDLHVKTRHTGEKSCRCDVCGKAYASVSVLNTHRRTHFDKTFACDVCGRCFFHACHLTRHKLSHSEEKPYRCDVCGRGFTQAENLRAHRAMHAGERQLCSVCGKSFRRLRNHMISKHPEEAPPQGAGQGEGPVGCDICGKKFPNASRCQAHQRSHGEEKPYRCDVCGKSYRLKELLRQHAHGHAHSEKKPYRCDVCWKTFSLAASFTRHRSIHTGHAPYSCSTCSKHFRLHAFLKAHLQTKAHLKQLQLTSDLCAINT